MATASMLYADQTRLPTVANPSFWSSLVPRFLRKPTTAEEAAARARRRDNVASEKRIGLTFLLLGILVGSNAINIIGLKREMLNFSRQTDAKLDLLREVVERVKKGEDVDVKKALGTDDPDQEKEWEQVIEELEKTDMLWEGRKKRDAKRAEKAEQTRLRDEERERERSKQDDKTTTSGPPSSRPKFLM
ncbi:hypothetical protein Slin15195_G016660 [Septoria linicola]|uniref:Uncharacterized protein n=1 Tax=Septoria linicola TaxID=215465 RepID=A0A9Q9EG44_9PEZI|nr:hypothetical protein Slin14017_G016730 [Septoria linicola]USW48347.1 hypothetical protein Slin15195_G016660 [Septoria linicola]